MDVGATADVLIVGGGPAGAFTAYRLARAGARVRLFDHSHPREKPCGGGLTGRALDLVRNAINLPALQPVHVDRGVFEDPRTAPAWLDMTAGSANAVLAVVSRQTFDAALLDAAEHAGARVCRERVVDVAVDSAGAHVRTAKGIHRGAWLVGADGANSLVRRRVHRAFRRDQLSIAAGVYASDRSESAIRIRFVPEPAGYLWSFPRADHLAIGICAQADHTSAARLRATLDTWCVSSGLTTGARLRAYGWPIPSLSAGDLIADRPASDRYLLVGDAAGLVDPITREGIFFALLSGQFAAEALQRTDDVAKAYLADLDAHVYPELTRAARLKHGFFRGPFTRLVVDALRHSAAVRGVMVDLVAGVQPYRTLKLRLVRTWEWRLAWQLLRLEAGRPRAAAGGTQRAS